MELCNKLILTFALLFLSVTNFGSFSFVFSQIENSSDANNEPWLSESNNLNITMTLNPKVPTIDQPTEIQFEIRELTTGKLFSNLDANVTILDSDSRLFKFPEQPVSDGKFSVIYIFPDDAENNVILQMDRNSTSFAIASFKIIVPPPPPPGDLLSQLLKPRPF